ncbi:hypothetical protein [Hymenobacter metallicola]|uniref:Uncharacterized protein n=1 Tax=Hymenobacter metallicola TaxID=2563114 RepID=A0A4Z0PW02_9BACT|nr:hypothetical protein [Hymenobacter metallicola]TGE21141.1 hypothetical protein E5K02_24325 [Hymenobacter metallicola]
MAAKLGAQLPPQHRKFYRKVLRPGPRLSLSQQFRRLLFITLGALGAALLIPFIPSCRHSVTLPSTLEDYAPKLLASVVLAPLLFGYGIYYYLITPRRQRRLGYQQVGQFVVLSKTNVLGSAWLTLTPTETHRIAVEPALFAKLEVGDAVEVVYSASDELVSIRPLPGANATR